MKNRDWEIYKTMGFSWHGVGDFSTLDLRDHVLYYMKVAMKDLKEGVLDLMLDVVVRGGLNETNNG